MALRSLGNPVSIFIDYLAKTGTDASGAPLLFQATGGTVTAPGNGYKYHTFTAPGTFTVNSGSATIEYLVVAGGGGGGTGDTSGRAGGGGGAGGVLNASITVGGGTYTIQVGGGGPTLPNSTAATPGTPSFITGPGITSITSYGGGGGAGGLVSTAIQGLPGGSGGGGQSAAGGFGYNPTTPAPVLASVPLPSPYPITQGYPGGSTGNAAGGGGAGAAGSNPNAGPGGNGVQFPAFTGPLIGVPSLAPLSGYFAGGGGGGTGASPGVPGTGGLGGGAQSNGGSATTNSGGGGGGGAGPGGSPLTGGTGASGIVVIRYLA